MQASNLGVQASSSSLVFRLRRRNLAQIGMERGAGRGAQRTQQNVTGSSDSALPVDGAVPLQVTPVGSNCARSS